MKIRKTNPGINIRHNEVTFQRHQILSAKKENGGANPKK